MIAAMVRSPVSTFRPTISSVQTSRGLTIGVPKRLSELPLQSSLALFTSKTPKVYLYRYRRKIVSVPNAIRTAAASAETRA